jgi:hypothetical protein
MRLVSGGDVLGPRAILLPAVEAGEKYSSPNVICRNVHVGGQALFF